MSHAALAAARALVRRRRAARRPPRRRASPAAAAGAGAGARPSASAAPLPCRIAGAAKDVVKPFEDLVRPLHALLDRQLRRVVKSLSRPYSCQEARGRAGGARLQHLLHAHQLLGLQPDALAPGAALRAVCARLRAAARLYAQQRAPLHLRRARRRRAVSSCPLPLAAPCCEVP